LEFVERGEGTPIPYDAPKRLVTSGMYRYVANPMQLSCGVVMLGWAALLCNWWMALAAAMAIIYSAGIAEWDEGRDLERRFGSAWKGVQGRDRELASSLEALLREHRRNPVYGRNLRSLQRTLAVACRAQTGLG